MATAANNPVAVIRQNLTAMAPEFRAALPAHVPVEKFTRVAMTAIQNNPDLQGADRRSLFGAIVRLAQDGLLPDGREAAIVLFGNKAQAMPMIAGVLKKIRQSGDVSYISAQIVYANDRFKWTLGFDENVEHEPAPLDQEPGEPVAAYAVAVLKDGSRLLEVMRKSEIEKVRQVSRAKNNGPWVQWWGEMARKTVMRRLSKRLPMSTDLDDHFERDATMRANDNAEPAVIDVEAREPVGRLEALEQHIEDEAEEVEAEIVDDDTGEVVEGATGERPDDAEPGELALDTDWHAKANEFLGGIRNAKKPTYLDAIEQSYRAVMADMPREHADRVEGALAERRAALAGEG